MGLDEEKRKLRRSLARGFVAREPAETRRAEERVAERVAATPEFQAAARVAVYAALPDEPPTRALFEAARGAGKCLLFPVCRADASLEFAAVDRWEDLRPGRYGVLEPPGAACREELEPGDLALLPGLAFDAAGRRLGRGKGYYDRTFPAGREQVPVLFGCAFEERILDEVPAGPMDRRVDAVVTERRILRVPGARGGERGRGR